MIRDPSDGSIKPTLQTLDHLRAKYGPNWGMNVEDKLKRPVARAPTNEELIDHYREYGLAFQPKQQTAAE